MYEIGDKVLYGIHGVCTICKVETRTLYRKQVEYYVLEPTDQPGTRFLVPKANPSAVAKMRPLLSRGELEELIRTQAHHTDVWISDETRRKQCYRELINSGDRGALLAMVGCLYRHKQEQNALGRKFHLCDENFLRDAQKLLDAEFAQVLGLKPCQVADYLREQFGVQ